ncbi:hypothetical protein HDU98_009253 [Podochytrium sp. JEL0797]|nr:hypothetical protein HDU98_009253 [Podochytrium sp. JEL0797]
MSTTESLNEDNVADILFLLEAEDEEGDSLDLGTVESDLLGLLLEPKTSSLTSNVKRQSGASSTDATAAHSEKVAVKGMEDSAAAQTVQTTIEYRDTCNEDIMSEDLALSVTSPISKSRVSFAPSTKPCPSMQTSVSARLVLLYQKLALLMDSPRCERSPISQLVWILLAPLILLILVPWYYVLTLNTEYEAITDNEEEDDTDPSTLLAAITLHKLEIHKASDHAFQQTLLLLQRKFVEYPQRLWESQLHVRVAVFLLGAIVPVLSLLVLPGVAVILEVWIGFVWCWYFVDYFRVELEEEKGKEMKGASSFT